MPYSVEQIKDGIHITAENWQRFQGESPAFRLTQADRFWFRRWTIRYSGDCEINIGCETNILFYCWDEWDEDCEQWLECLAPYAVDGSELALRGEDGEIWGYRFENGRLNHTKGMKEV